MGTIFATKLGGRTRIPRNGAVLVARGKAVTTIEGEAAEGLPLTVRLRLTPSWPMVDALGGGPALVRDGKPIFRALEAFTVDQVTGFDPRTAVGQRADGSLVFVAVDGRQPGYSAGITNFDLAKLLARLGAETGSALDSGGSTTLAFEGRLLNRPSDPGGERAVAEALVLGYAGVYTPAPAALVSPNGDGIADAQRLRYKVVERSTVDARLIGPGGRSCRSTRASARAACARSGGTAQAPTVPPPSRASGAGASMPSTSRAGAPRASGGSR